MKWWVIIGLVAAGIGFGGWYWKQRANTAPPYQTRVVARGDLIQTVTATGQLNPVVNVQVGSQISGTILKLFVDFNSPVQAGQVVAQLDPATYQANVHQAEGELANARANRELARINAARARELFEAKLIPQSERDQSVATLQQAEATVTIREAALARSQIDLARCTIYSPVDGSVISRSVDVGQTVAASLSAPTLFVIANDLAKMQINANVAEADVGGIEIGQVVNFTVDAFPRRTFPGRVIQVRNSPVTIQNVVTYDTVVAVDNADLKLKPGMTANVSIILAQRENVLTIPNAALRFRPVDEAAAKTNQTASAGAGRGSRRRNQDDGQTSRTVYTLANGGKGAAPVAVTIETGIGDGVATEVVSGLQEGDVVVTSQTQPTGSNTTPAANPFGGGMRRF